jgi:hypothetical protein
VPPFRHRAQLGHRDPRNTAPPASESHDPLGHPRPQFRRHDWLSLNGEWDFAIDPEGEWTRAEVPWDRRIRVPFAPETRASGVADSGLYKAVWYRLRLRAPRLGVGERLLLHFGAVDYHAMVWVDATLVAEHEGGYTPFEADITEALRSDVNEHEVVVRAYDDPADLEKPRGKQDWQLEPHSIWYPRTTGIWQTVWLERVPSTRITRAQWTANLERWEIGIDAFVLAVGARKLQLSVKLWVDELLVAHDQYLVVAGEVHRRIALSDPGIDDFRNELLWSPASPKLIDAELLLLDDEGRTLDRVDSYTALRAFSVQGDRFSLNGRAYPLRMVLDQGYWPESGMTPLSDSEVRRDVELAKAMGFNGVRKHQKIELPRYLYWADRLGLLVWEEMPSAYRFTRRSVEVLTAQWLEAMRRDASHPCIMAWVPFNESWGVPNLPSNLPERNYVRAMYYLTKTQDPTRPVVGNDGWESVATDIIGVHDYDDQPERIERRYFTRGVPALLKHERPGGRALVLEGPELGEHPVVLSEFGGMAVRLDAENTWAYSSCNDTEEFSRRFAELLQVVRSLELLAGFCYTQFADTYQEVNGLLRADRTPKLPLASIADAVTGVRSGAKPLPESVAVAGPPHSGPPHSGPPHSGPPHSGPPRALSADPDATLILRPKK